MHISTVRLLSPGPRTEIHAASMKSELYFLICIRTAVPVIGVSFQRLHIQSRLMRNVNPRNTTTQQEKLIKIIHLSVCFHVKQGIEILSTN